MMTQKESYELQQTRTWAENGTYAPITSQFNFLDLCHVSLPRSLDQVDSSIVKLLKPYMTRIQD